MFSIKLERRLSAGAIRYSASALPGGFREASGMALPEVSRGRASVLPGRASPCSFGTLAPHIHYIMFE